MYILVRLLYACSTYTHTHTCTHINKKTHTNTHILMYNVQQKPCKSMKKVVIADIE